MTKNRRWLVNGDPRGRALALTDWIVDEEELAPLGNNQVRVKTEILAYQPAQKGQMEVIPGYSSGSPVGTVMGSPGVGEVGGDALLHHRVRDFGTQMRVFREITAAQAVLDDPQTAEREIARVLATAAETRRPVYIELPRDCAADDLAIPQ